MDRYLYEETRLNMVRRARNFAVASLSCSIILFTVPYIALGLGFFAILFAFLSKGYRGKMDREAVTAVKFAIVGIVIGALRIVFIILWFIFVIFMSITDYDSYYDEYDFSSNNTIIEVIDY